MSDQLDLAGLNDDERRILEVARDRLLLGRKAYGAWDVSKDPRNNPREALEEAIDGFVYAGAELVKLIRQAAKPIRFVYVSGPLTTGPLMMNVRAAAMTAKTLRTSGFVPIVPHTAVLEDLAAPGTTYEEWMAHDLQLIEICDAVLRMAGESPGGDREVAHAQTLGKPVFYSVLDLVEAQRHGRRAA